MEHFITEFLVGQLLKSGFISVEKFLYVSPDRKNPGHLHFFFLLFSGLSALERRNKDYRVREKIHFRSANVNAILLSTLEDG